MHTYIASPQRTVGVHTTHPRLLELWSGEGSARAGRKAALADFNGDGLSEVFEVLPDGTWRVGTVTLSGGSGFRLGWRTLGIPHVFRGHYTVFLGHHYASDRADVLGFDESGHWWLGRLVNNQLAWSPVGDTAGFGNLMDGEHFFIGADFLGMGRSQTLFHYRQDRNWWLGWLDDSPALQWLLVGNTSGFGDLFDGRHLMRIGNFKTHLPPRMDILFQYVDDGNWWVGSIDAPPIAPPPGEVSGELNWTSAGNTLGFGNLLDGRHETWAGSFEGGVTDGILFYYAEDGNWWFGVGTPLIWSLLSSTRDSYQNFGDLLDGRHLIRTGAFKELELEVLFHYANDGNWWLGQLNPFAYWHSIQWTGVGNTIGAGDLLDGQHQFWAGRLAQPFREDLLIFDNTSQRWSLGAFDSTRHFNIGPVSEMVIS